MPAKNLELILGVILLGKGVAHTSENTEFWTGGSGGLLLVLGELLVLLLELLDFGLEEFLGILDLLLECLDLVGPLVLGEGGNSLDLGLLVIVAQVEIVVTTAWAEVLRGEGLEGIVVSATLVLVSGWVGGTSEVLDGWVSFHSEFGAHILVLVSGAVNINNCCGFGVFEIF